MGDPIHWEERYQAGNIPWDTGEPSTELVRLFREEQIPRGRAVEFGCGTGTNAVWLARQGFEVTGVDLSPKALEKARQRADEAGVRVTWVAADLLKPTDLGPPLDFFFDRGCYHVLRRENVAAYLDNLDRSLKPGALGLVLAGNAKEPQEPGPPVVSEEQLREELGRVLDILWLREFRFDQPQGMPGRPLAWSCCVRKRN